MKRVLIIGSSGQIGTMLMKACKEAHIEATGIDLRPNSWDPSLTSVLADAQSYEPDMESVTDIVFLATEPSARRLEKDPDIQKRDYSSFQHALELARKQHARLIIISSRELFGVSQEEIRGFMPKNAYEKQKHLFETELLKESAYGILRVPIVYGGYDTDIDRLPRLIPRWCKTVLEGEAPAVTNGDSMVNLLHAEPLTQELLQLLNGGGSFLKELRGESMTLNELAALIQETDNNKNNDGAGSTLLRRGITQTYESLKARRELLLAVN